MSVLTKAKAVLADFDRLTSGAVPDQQVEEAREILENVIKLVGDQKTDAMVEHPNHYNQGEFECIDVIHDWDLDWNLGNAVKYICRARYKGNFKRDLEKAIFHIRDEVNRFGMPTQAGDEPGTVRGHSHSVRRTRNKDK